MAAAGLDVERKRVLAYRVAAHQLDRSAPDADALAVLDLGVQDTPYGSARLALAARLKQLEQPQAAAPAAKPTADTAETADTADTTADTAAAEDADDAEAQALPLVWTTRGAPHVHRRRDLPALAAALWPLSDADATARIASTQIREGSRLGVAAFTAAAEAMREVVRGPMPKGEVSTAVSALVPPPLTFWCRACEAQHISGALFQQVGVFAGVRLGRDGAGTLLAPVPGLPAVPKAASGTAGFVRSYLRLLGPATVGEAAKFLGTTQAEAGRAWPQGLVEVRVGGRRAWLPEEGVAVLRSAPEPRLVRLLPPSDPYLQARDRGVLVPDRERQSAVWRILASPGALLVDGEIGGVWRARLASRGRLDVTVTPFEPLSARVLAAVESEAERMAAVRGAAEVRVLLEDA